MIALFIKSLFLEGRILVAGAINLRKRTEREVPASDLISAPVGATIALPVKLSDSVLTIARNFHEKLNSHIHSKELLLQHYALIRGQLALSEFQSSFFLSNIGKTSYPKEIGDQIPYLYFASKALFKRPFLACITHQQTMAIAGTFSEPWISSSQMSNLIKSLLEPSL